MKSNNFKVYVSIVVILNLGRAVYCQDCESALQCLRLSVIPGRICSLCNEGQCQLTLSKHYRGNNCELLPDDELKCENQCGDHGKCGRYNDRYMETCVCDAGYYGPRCEQKQRQYRRMIRGITYEYIDYVNPGQGYKLKVVVLGESMADFEGMREITVTTTEGFYRKIKTTGPGRLMNQCPGKNRACVTFEVDDFRVAFVPLIEYSRQGPIGGNRWFTMNQNEIVGVTRTDLGLQFTTVQHGLKLTSGKYTMWANYGGVEPVNLVCMPSLFQTKACAWGYNKPSKRFRTTLIYFENAVEYVENGRYINLTRNDNRCVNDVRLQSYWEIVKYDKRLGYTSPPVLVSSKRGGRFSPVIKPYTLTFGSYRASWLVIVLQSSSTVANFASCFFKVINEPLVATISGGSARLVLKHAGLSLSAQESYDPNYPPWAKEQSQLKCRWKCERIPFTRDPLCEVWTSPTSFKIPLFIQGERLTYSAVYKFTLYLYTEADDYKTCNDCNGKARYQHVRVEVAPEGTMGSPVTIICVQNCYSKVIPNKILFLKSSIANMSQNLEFKWIYYKSNFSTIPEELPADNIKVPDLPPQMLIVKENTLEMGTAYTIEVRVNNSEMYAKYSIVTDILKLEWNCTVEPLKGIKGETSFDISCTVADTGILVFEFYDKTTEEANEDVIFNGRMLGSSAYGELRGVKLLRGTVCVYIINRHGLHLNKTFKVELSLSADTHLLDGLLQNLVETPKKNFDDCNRLRLISLISHLILPEGYKSDLLNTLGDSISYTPTSTLLGLKLCSSALFNVLFSLNQHTQLTTRLMFSLQTFIQQLSDILRINVKDHQRSQWMTVPEIEKVAQHILDCLYKAFENKDNRTEGIDADDLDFQDLSKLRKISESMENTIDDVNDVLSYLHAPGQPPFKVNITGNSLVTWVVTNDKDLSLVTQLETEVHIPVDISSALMSNLEKRIGEDQQLTLQTTIVDENLFWWSQFYKSANMVSVSLTILDRRTDILKRIVTVEPPLKLHITMKDGLLSQKVTGTTIQLDTTLETLYLDLTITVHRLDSIPKSLTNIKFLFPETNGSLRVLIRENMRPDYNLVNRKSISVTNDSPVYKVPFKNDKNPIFLYMAILPGRDIPINQTVTYEFEVNSTVCQRWNQGIWTSAGCSIDPENTKNKNIVCRCNHLSIFTATFPVPPEDIDPFADFKLFLTVIYNPIPAFFVTTIIMCYLISLYFSWHRDKYFDRYVRTVIVLEDNFPIDPFPYLIAVYTSPRYNAGTTANVVVKLYGKDTQSRAHRLRSKERKVLKKGFDDWFLIFSPEYLGKVNSIHLWHDNTGRSPDWFCNRVFVYDLTHYEEYMFVVEDWIAVSENSFPEAVMLPAVDEDVKEIKSMFYENVFLGLRDDHMMFSVMLRHPRSEMTCVQRLTVCMCALMAASLTSIMFYKPSESGQGVDDSQYSLRQKEVIVTLEALGVCAVVNTIVNLPFRRGHTNEWNVYRSQAGEEEDTLNLRRKKVSRDKKNNTFFSNFEKFMNRIRSPPLAPAQIKQSKKVGRTRIMLLFIVWIVTSTVIMVCSYLIVLYGLKMGTVKSQKCITTILLAWVGHIFVTCPIKIFAYSVLLAIAFQRLLDVDTYVITANDIQFVKSLMVGTDVVEQIETRKQSMYAPLSDLKRAEILKKKQGKANWLLLLDFIISLGFVIVTYAVISNQWSGFYYYNRHVVQEMTEYFVPFMKSPTFFQVRNIPDLEVYLRNTYLYALYSTRWYNGDYLDKNNSVYKYWLRDGINRMIGRPRVRQFRALPRMSKLDQLIGSYLYIPEWSRDAEDTNPYSEGWAPGVWHKAQKTLSPWEFTEPNRNIYSTLCRPYGKFGVFFHNGGFSVTLGPTRQDAERVLAELQTSHWLDARARVFFAEMTVYNVNQDLYTQLTLIVEFLASGKILLKAQAFSIHRSHEIFFSGMAFITFIIFYVCRSFLLMNNQGLVKYLSNVTNVLRTAIVTLGLTAIVFQCLHIYTSSVYSEKYHNENLDIYFDYDQFSIFFLLMEYDLILLFCVATFNLIGTMRFGSTLVNYFIILTRSLKWLSCMTLIVLISIVAMSRCIYWIHASSLFGVVELLMKHRLTRHSQYNDWKHTYLSLFIAMKMVCSFIILSGFIVLFIHTLKLANNNRLDRTRNFNFILFLIYKLRRRRQEGRNKSSL